MSTIFQSRDLNNETAWFFWHGLDGGIGTAIGPFASISDAEDCQRALNEYLNRATRLAAR